jgi:two-component system sensor histidine kinase KdpD
MNTPASELHAGRPGDRPATRGRPEGLTPLAWLTGHGHPRALPRWPALLIWALGAPLMHALDGRLDLANLALLLVLLATLASLWLPAWAALASGVLAVALFNWAFVPPRHSMVVELGQHTVLLLAMLALNLLVAALMHGLRRQARLAQRAADRAGQLHAWGDLLRASHEPQAQAGALQQALRQAAGVPVALAVLRASLPPGNDDSALLRVDDADTSTDADQRAGLWLCLRDGRPLGPGTGRHGEQPDLYLPLRSSGHACGAALLWAPPPGLLADASLRAHLQALCDLCGDALARAQVQREQTAAQLAAQTSAVRAALLAAISHDYRTPLATILGAASALQEQGERLTPAQRQRHLQGIVDEADRLARLTDNTLQLARLDAPDVQLRCDWESPEEIVGVALRQARRHPAGQRVRARLEPGLPLLWCDATLISQLLANLIDNALAYSPHDTPVELLVRRAAPPLDHLVLAVRDRGPGIAPAWRGRVFEVFQRGADPMAAAPAAAEPRQADAQRRGGSGVGLAVCRAIARAHGGDLTLRARGHGGCSFEAVLPLHEPPARPADDDNATSLTVAPTTPTTPTTKTTPGGRTTATTATTPIEPIEAITPTTATAPDLPAAVPGHAATHRQDLP